MHQESQEIQDDAWDCTLIKTMKEHQDSIVNPVYEWSDADVWDYIKRYELQVNPLYDMGYERVGCIGCPLAPYHQRKKEFADFPKYKTLYINAFDKAIENRKKRGLKEIWKTGQEMFDWWMEENKYNVKGQMSLFE